MQYLTILPEDHILILAPHPDDESIGCGGLLTLYSEQCDVVLLTDGRQGQGDIEPTELKKIRSNEFNSVMKQANIVNYHILDIEDGTLLNHQDVLNNIDLKRYTKIFVTGSRDGHPDHTGAFLILCKICREQDIKAQIFIYEVHIPLERPTHALDITKVIDRKEQLIRLYESQLKNFRFDVLSFHLNAFRAVEMHIVGGYAEAYTEISPYTVCGDEGRGDAELQKMREYYWIYTRWMILHQQSRSVADYVYEKGFVSVIVYGYKEFGQLLANELSQRGIKIPYVIDKMNIGWKDGRFIRHLDDIDNKERDLNAMIIVTATYYFDDICRELRGKKFQNIFSLKRILEEMQMDI